MVFQKYETRFEAGEVLADFIKETNKKLNDFITQDSSKFFCFAIPNGGVPVIEGFCSKFNLNYDILILRKIKIPYNTEAGFGSITTDGTVLINESLLNQLNLSQQDIENSIDLTKREINERLRFYNREIDLGQFYENKITDKQIFILDDGLASGFTMLAGIKMIKKYHPQGIFIAIPTAPLRTVNRIEKEVDNVFCPNIRNVIWFAVADAYKNWYDIPENEVLNIINHSKYYYFNVK